MSENKEVKEAKEAKEEQSEEKNEIVVKVEELPKVLERIAELEKKIDALTPKNESGKGEVLSAKEDYRKKIVESLKSGRSLREQWEAPISLPEKPTAGIASFIQRSNEIRGRMGDTVTIPYVKDFDMDVLSSVGDSLTAKSNLYGTVSTTLKEAAAYTTIPYADLEKLSEDLLAELEARFAKAALRAIDKHILDTLIADANVPELDKSGETVEFDADWIAEALSLVAQNGKSIDPQDFILVISPKMYEALYKDIAASQALVYARPDVVRDGMVAEFMGVRILVSSYLPEHDETNGYLSAYLIHKNAIVFAPKRELLIETERDTVNRQVKLTGSYTFGVAVIDKEAIVEIKTIATA
ncbi:phage major capsid protein [Candidatus Bathyarchaeota archaeon]|nr:phage major capsid protein [Candidatus Bathyarchaeota archaeon]